MDVWGLLLNGIGAVLNAAGQEIVAGVTAIWLRAHEAILGGRGTADRVTRVDDQMDRAIKKTDGYRASAGRCSSPASSYK